ncbi:MAG: type VI secretion system contractile sheath small subunit [Gemmatimonadales bacterium]|mgnify:CR=1 FL=1|nr:type VI secretion system contractile sheath small subunit [Gemmatimonadales bacterium]
MPVVKVTRAGVKMAPRQVPTETTATILPMTVDRVGQEALEDEQPTKVSSLAEAFEKFKPALDFKTNVGDEGTEFAAELEFKSLKDFDPKRVMTREPGKRNDVADLQSQIDLLHRMRERFAVLSVRRAWDNPDQRKEIIEAVAEFQDALRKISGGDA